MTTTIELFVSFFTSIVYRLKVSKMFSLFYCNRATEAAMNLFINSNAQELLKEMKPALKEKLTVLLHNFMENLFSRIPFDEWVE